VFKVSGYIEFAGDTPGMMVPMFAKIGTNTPYVQSMDEFYDIEDFFAYYQYENFAFISEGRTIEAEVGQAGLIAFRTYFGEIWCGNAPQAVEYLNLQTTDLDHAPLLKLQLLRLSNAPLAQQYEAWRNAADKYFKSSRQRARWIDAELLSYQSDERVWNRINAKKGERRKSIYLVADKLKSVDPEHRFEVLSNPQYFDFSDWELEWFKLKEQLPSDERVHLLANDWLYYIFSSNLEVVRTKNVFAESIRFWRLQHSSDDQLADFLLELIRSGQFFSDELSFSFSSLLAALDVVQHDLPHEDYISLLLTILASNYFSAVQSEALLARIEEVAQPIKVLASDFWPSRPSGVVDESGREMVTLESWKDVAAGHQDILEMVFNRIGLLDEKEAVVRTFVKKWKPLLRSKILASD
jgi:hypothetical protein